jgi:uncharacterized protein YajQ (UPF0234 family)
MAQFSFDLVSEYDIGEVNNVFDQSLREINNRYDFKSTPANLEWLNSEKTGLKITGNSDYQIEAILEIVRKKLAVRGQDQKILDVTCESITSNLKTVKEVPFIQGLNQEKAKKITKLLREKLPKIKAQVQGETIRITSSSKDDLQQAMQIIRAHNFEFPINFTNFK